MSGGAIVAIIVAVVVVLLVVAALSTARRRKLRQKFGPEYDRVVGEMRRHRRADAELAERERRVRSLDIHPLDETVRVKYTGEWTAIQELFAPAPGEGRAKPRGRWLYRPEAACRGLVLARGSGPREPPAGLRPC